MILLLISKPKVAQRCSLSPLLKLAVNPGHPNLTEGEVRSHLGSFGLGRLAVSPIRRPTCSLVFSEIRRQPLAAGACREESAVELLWRLPR